MLLKLVEAAQDLESIFWRQSDPKALELYKRLQGCTAPDAQKLRRFLMTVRGLSEEEAISLISVGADFGVTQVVDANWGVHGTIRKNMFRCD